MKSTKKSILFFLVLTLVLAMILNGCTKTEPTDNTQVNNSTQVQTTQLTTTQPTTTEPTTTEPKKRVTITINGDDFGVVPDIGNPTENFFLDWINENSPVILDVIPIVVAESQDRINMLFAAGDAPDLIMHPWQDAMLPWANQGMLMPLDDLIANHSTNYKEILFDPNPDLQAYSKLSNGITYFFCGKRDALSPNHTMILRKDWLTNLGLSIPKTDEELFEVAKAFTFNDPDKNGQNDTYGMELSWISGWAIDAMYKALDYQIEGNTLKKDFDHWKDATAFKKRLYDAKVVNPDYLTDKTGTNADERFLNGKLGIYVRPRGQINKAFISTFDKNNPNGEFIPINLPATKYGSFSPAMSAPIVRRYAINASTKYAEEIMEYIDWTIDPKIAKIFQWGFEGRHHIVDENGYHSLVSEEPATTEFTKVIAKHYLGELARFSFTRLLPENERMTAPPTNPIDQKVFDMTQLIIELYVNPEHPMWRDFISAPSLPDELSLIEASIKQPIEDMWARAVVSGDKYTVEQAYQDIVSLWKSSGGDNLEAFYKDWYENSQSSIVFTKDFY